MDDIPLFGGDIKPPVSRILKNNCHKTFIYLKHAELCLGLAVLSNCELKVIEIHNSQSLSFQSAIEEFVAEYVAFNDL